MCLRPWVKVGVLGSVFGLEILEEKGWDFSKEEERRRGSGLRRSGHGHGGGEWGTQKGGVESHGMKNEGRGIPNGVNTLIYTIIKHFVGKSINITSRIYDQLSNLRYRTLGDYRWYNDVFTTRVMHKSDCNSPFWKEKFINGLPKLFDEKVKETLCNPLGVIDYDNLTYGDISSTIQSEGMKMCRDFKIQSQASKSKAKYEVGNFCTQYGLPPIAPSKRKSKFRGKESPEKFHRKRTASKYYRK
ncbi:hypothetical protein SO802_002505 [Lithocarpus litseifolius]|uniref:Uncharacterized protein n=1 Tax=Lithocarpus litseifolius TaxID=425828 RepID=A0AAW2E2S3_9ROSI